MFVSGNLGGQERFGRTSDIEVERMCQEQGVTSNKIKTLGDGKSGGCACVSVSDTPIIRLVPDCCGGHPTRKVRLSKADADGMNGTDDKD